MKQNDDEWTILYCTAVVEFKMLDTSLKLELTKTVRAFKPLALEDSGPLCQAMSHLSTLVWPSLRYMRSTESAMPILVIAGTRESNRELHLAQSRYIRGDFVPPATCGGGFSYKISIASSASNNNAMSQALYEYLQIIEVGFDIAFKFCIASEVGPPVPLGGLGLPHELKPLVKNETLTFVSSPICCDNLRSSQGDIWGVTTTYKDINDISMWIRSKV